MSGIGVCCAYMHVYLHTYMHVYIHMNIYTCICADQMYKDIKKNMNFTCVYTSPCVCTDKIYVDIHFSTSTYMCTYNAHISTKGVVYKHVCRRIDMCALYLEMCVDVKKCICTHIYETFEFI